MTNQELYKIVHTVVQRAIQSGVPNRGTENMWDFAKGLPNPEDISNDLAEALIVSVSHTGGELGLECFFKEKVLPSDVAVFDSSVRDELGWFVRHNYNGHAVMNEDMIKLVNSL